MPLWKWGKIKNGIEGIAHVAACTGIPPSMQNVVSIGSTYECEMDLVVQAADKEPYAATITANIDPNRPVEPGMDIPVTIDPEDPSHIKVNKKRIPSSDEKASAAQQAALESAQAQWRREHGGQG
jgi:hypothetical protein